MEKLEKLQSIAKNLLQLGCDEVVITFDNVKTKIEIENELNEGFDLLYKRSNISPKNITKKRVEIETDMIKIFGVTFHIVWSL